MAEREPEEIERDIEQTRQEMGDTVEELAERADVKAQAQEKVEEMRAHAREKVAGVRQQARERVAQARERLGATGGEPAGPGIASAESSGPSVDPAQLAAAARENPGPLAFGAFLAGFLLGRLTSR